MVTVTERARKLRAQYMMQAQGLRTRIEIRVNRIPMALRRANMGELFSKHREPGKQQSAIAVPSAVIRSAVVVASSKSIVQETQRSARQSLSPMRGAKRLRFVNSSDSYR
jgi:Nbl1 / Borealin N terminal